MGLVVEAATEAETLDTADTAITAVGVLVEDMVVTMVDEADPIAADLMEVEATSTAIKVDQDILVALDKEAMLSDLATGAAHLATLTTLHPASSACGADWPNLRSGTLRQRHPVMVPQ